MFMKLLLSIVDWWSYFSHVALHISQPWCRLSSLIAQQYSMSIWSQEPSGTIPGREYGAPVARQSMWLCIITPIRKSCPVSLKFLRIDKTRFEGSFLQDSAQEPLESIYANLCNVSSQQVMLVLSRQLLFECAQVCPRIPFKKLKSSRIPSESNMRWHPEKASSSS